MQPDIVQPVLDVPQLSPTVFYQIGHFFASLWQPGVGIVQTILAWAVVISIPLALFFIVAIIYSVEQLKVIKNKEKEKYDVKKVEPAFQETKAPQGTHDLAVKWQRIQELMNSQNPNDWKTAILEADTMLLDVLTGLGYQGDGVGEKLKRIQPGEMKSIDDAWEAHKMRNQIAHTAGFQLDHHVALKTIHHFRKVFEEFFYI